MNILLRPVVAVALVWAMATGSARPAEPAAKLIPGSTFAVQFPDMPPTFYAVFQKTNVPAQMTVFLPTNFDPARKFPLFIFLNGWDGGVGGNPGVARSLCEGRDFVCVSVSLFKAPNFQVTKANAPGTGFIMDAEDGKQMWPCFKTMLTKLEDTVPNIDPAHRILGGFSNGAHATAGLIDESDGEITRRFTAFLFVEGGGKLQHYELLKGKPFLVVSSNANPSLAPSKSAMLLKPQGPKPPLSWRMLASTTSRRRRILPCASGCAERRWSEPTDHVNGLGKRLERKK